MSVMSDFIALHSLLPQGRADDCPVCHDGQRLVLWREFSARVAVQAGLLMARPEKRWLLASDDPQAFVINFLALLHAGKAVVIPPNTQPGTLTALAGVFDACLSDAPSASGSPLPAPLAAIDPGLAEIDLYTSGSSGEPKRVHKTLLQLEAEVAILESLWGSILGGAPIMATAPHQHIYGLLFRVLWPLSTGRVFDNVTCAHPDMLQQRLATFGRAALVSSPAQLSRLPELLTLASLGSQLNVIFSSGGPLLAATAQTFSQQLGAAPIEIFGSTETGGVAWRRQDARADADVWTSFPGIEVTASATGALTLRSPFIASDDPWVMDDGIALLSPGRFRLLGRLDRIVKIEEKRLSLPDMEARLSIHPWIAACALVSLTGRRQSIGAVIVLSAEGRGQVEREGRRALTQALRKHLAGYFEAVLLPRHWRLSEHLPTDARGKLAHAALESLFASAEAAVLYPDVLAVNHCTEGNYPLVLDLHVTASLTHFAGHFSGLPILPGVVQVDWAVRYARKYLALEGEFSALENVKFTGLVLPDDRLQLSLKWDAQRARLDFSYATCQRKFSTGRIVFAAG
jgi:3-hydroxymyristoyl/3-hydroxydecanoyl-(acyl carrier protein) dehydratase